MNKNLKRIGVSIILGLGASFLTGCQNPPEKVKINKMCVKGSVSRQTHAVSEIGNYQRMNMVKVVHKDGTTCDSNIHNMWFKYDIETGEIERAPYQYDITHLIVGGFYYNH